MVNCFLGEGFVETFRVPLLKEIAAAIILNQKNKLFLIEEGGGAIWPINSIKFTPPASGR